MPLWIQTAGPKSWGGGLPRSVLHGIHSPKGSSAGSCASVIWRPLFRGFPPKNVRKWGSQFWVIVALLMVFDGLLFVLLFCLWEVAFSSFRIYCRWEHQHAVKGLSPPPVTQIALLQLQRFLPLGARGLKPRLRYRSDSKALKLDCTVWCPSNCSDKDEQLLFILIIHSLYVYTPLLLPAGIINWCKNR